MAASRHHLILIISGLVFALAGCPTGKRKVASPEPPVPRDGNQEALRQFEQSQAQFRKDNGETVDPERFEAIVKDFPDDPIVPHALLYAGMSAVKAGEYPKAIENLDKLAAHPDADDALTDRGLFYRGLAKNYTGDYAGALRDLKAGEDSVGNAEGEREEWLAAMAIANASSGQVAAALGFYDQWYKSGRASERAFILATLEEAIGKMSDEDLEPAYKNLDKKGPSAAYAGRRLSGILRERGEDSAADKVDRETKDARKAMGLDVSVGGDSALGDPARVGGILPLSGRQSRIGEFSGRGLALAASFGDTNASGASSGWPRKFTLILRDSSSKAEKAAADLKELAAGDVIGVVGPIRRDSTRQVSAAASAISMPLVTLAGAPAETDSPFVFHIVHSPEARAEALARHAFNKGVKEFAILRPRVKYGERVAAAFEAEVERLGGHIQVNVSYPPDTTSFKKYTSKLKKPWQAIFIPDVAKKLELIAPALAVANFASRPRGEKGRGRSILLLSTAEALAPSFVKNAGRYTWGAVLAPGFYADERDGRIGPFVDRYKRSFGTSPTATDAYAFDAALAIRTVVEAGASTRGEVAADLVKVKANGLTGTVQFDAGTHLRSDGGVLFEVKEIAAGGHAIRAIR